MDKLQRNILSKEAEKQTRNNELIDLSVSIIKNIKNNNGFNFDYSDKAEGYSDQDIKSMIIERTGKLGFKDKSLIFRATAIATGVGVAGYKTLSESAETFIQGAMSNNILKSLHDSNLLNYSLAAMMTLYAVHFISKTKDRKISEESVLKKLFKDFDSNNQFKQSFSFAIDEHIHSRTGNFFATINKKALAFKNNLSDLTDLSKRVIKEAPKSAFNYFMKHINDKYLLKIDNTPLVKRKKQDGQMYNQFFNDLQDNIKSISKDKKTNKEIDQVIQKHFEEVCKKTYEDILTNYISRFGKQNILELLDNTNKPQFEKLKRLNEIAQLSTITSNDPLNKYTLISNVAKNFLDKYKNLSDKEFLKLTENSEESLNNIIREEIESIKFNFKDHPEIVNGNFNVIFENTLTNEALFFDDFFTKNKCDLIEEENAKIQAVMKLQQKRTANLS